MKADQTSFPDVKWTDFVVVLLGWWCEALNQAFASDAAPSEVYFMEGPFSAIVGPSVGGKIEVTLQERFADSSTEVFRGLIEDSVIVRNVLSVANEILIKCDLSGWVSADSEKLRREASTLARWFQ